MADEKDQMREASPASETADGSTDADKAPPHTASATDKELELDRPQSAPEAPQAPDGGLEAWMAVVAACLIYFNTWYVP
jgi:hypothetical protein